MELYSVATGNVGPSNMASTAVKFVNGLPGMVGVHTAYGIGTLRMFDSLDHARSAKSRWMRPEFSPEISVEQISADLRCVSTGSERME